MTNFVCIDVLKIQPCSGKSLMTIIALCLASCYIYHSTLVSATNTASDCLKQRCKEFNVRIKLISVWSSPVQF